MADAKITALTENTTPIGTDIIPMVDDPGGSPATQKVTLANLGLSDGWIAGMGTWTYASASTFTVAGDYTAVFTKGTRLKFTQTSIKYAVVLKSSYSAPNTTVTIAINTDYTIANAAITAPYYSHEVKPGGYPGWFNWTPTYTSGGGAYTNPASTNEALYAITGDLLSVVVRFTLGNPAGGSGEARITLFSSIQGSGGYFYGGGRNSSTGTSLICNMFPGGSYISLTGFNDASPLGNGYILGCSITSNFSVP